MVTRRFVTNRTEPVTCQVLSAGSFTVLGEHVEFAAGVETAKNCRLFQWCLYVLYISLKDA
jgi:hypothetical protein